MKTIICLAILCSLVSSASAQTYTLNWGSSFTPAWATGNTSGTANNIGGSSVNCNVTMTKSAGIFTTTLGPYGGPMTPTVTSSTFIVAGSSSNIQISLDYPTNTDYCDIKFNFNKPVFNVSFNLADIDRLTNTLYNYLDKVTITGTDGVVTGSPTITKYDAVTDPGFMFISGNTAYVNPANGSSGNTASDATDQKGTIKVKFGGVFITSFTIRYSNYAGTQADPTVQNIAIGNISFQKSIPVPVTLLSFDGHCSESGPVQLDWMVDHESGFDHYEVEKSSDGKEFHYAGTVDGKNDGQRTVYHYTDGISAAGKYYYRLKLVDGDGSISYSKIISLIYKPAAGFMVFPTITRSEFILRFSSQHPGLVKACLVNCMGEMLMQLSHMAVAGTNEIRVVLPPTLPSGQYYLVMGTRKAAIIKQ